MIFVSKRGQSGCPRKISRPGFFLVWLALLFFPALGHALPTRLVLALDGVSYRDLKALQTGITVTNFWGKPFQRRAFTSAEGYFPVSRMISTFPSASDVAWTDIFGDRPLPGYQRTYFSVAANAEVSINGVTTSMEHERQMHWQVENGFLRAMGYMYPLQIYKLELRGMVKNFWQATNLDSNFYVYVRASDDAQHMDCDITKMLCLLDEQLQDLRARYRAQTGRDLQIVILSDHGHNHAGRGRRVAVNAFLEKAGYHVGQSLTSSQDVILPTVGVESWVEIHNAPAETATLAQRLCQLPGVDVLAAILPERTASFLVMNSKSARAIIDWNPKKNSFRYTAERGDPINYNSVVRALAQNGQLDAAGFASADDWMKATMTNHYPLALERIVRGLTRNTLNPATILISLDNRYVNDSWPVQMGSRLVSCRSTHGGLDDINSDGILLCNFAPTRDTSTARVADQFESFAGLKNFRAEENGAEFVTKNEQSLTRIPHEPFDRMFNQLPAADVFLRIWSPQLARFPGASALTVDIEKTRIHTCETSPRGDHQIRRTTPRPIILDPPVSFSGQAAGERIYAFPPDLKLEPQTEYKISGWMHAPAKTSRLFEFLFHTGRAGRPAAF